MTVFDRLIVAIVLFLILLGLPGNRTGRKTKEDAEEDATQFRLQQELLQKTLSEYKSAYDSASSASLQKAAADTAKTNPPQSLNSAKNSRTADKDPTAIPDSAQHKQVLSDSI